MLKDAQALEDYIVTMSNTVVLGKQWQGHDVTPEDMLKPTGLLMYTDRGEVPQTSVFYRVAQKSKPSPSDQKSVLNRIKARQLD